MSLLRRSTAAGDYTNLLRRSVGGAVFPNRNERVGTSDAPPLARGGLAQAFAELSYLDGVAYANTVWTGSPGWNLGGTLYRGGSGVSRLNTIDSYYHCSFTFRVAGTSTDAPLTVGLYRDDSNGYIATFGTGIVQGLNGLVFLQGTIFDGTTTSTFTYSNGNLFNLTLVKNVLTFTQNGAPVLAPTTVSGVYRFFGSILTTQGTGQSVSSWSFQLVPVRWWELRGGDADLINWSLSKVYARHLTTVTNFAYWLAPYVAGTLTFSVTKSGSSPMYVGLTADPSAEVTSGQTGPLPYVFIFTTSTYSVVQAGETPTTLVAPTSYTSSDTFEVIYNQDGAGAITIKQNTVTKGTGTYGDYTALMYAYVETSSADQLNNFSYVEDLVPPAPVSRWIPIQGNASVWSFTNNSRNVQYIGSDATGEGVSSISFFGLPAASLTFSGGVTDLSFYQVGFSTTASAATSSGQVASVYADISRADDGTTRVQIRRRRGSAVADILGQGVLDGTLSSGQCIVDVCYNAYFQFTDNTGSKTSIVASDVAPLVYTSDLSYCLFLGTNIPNGAFTDVSIGNRPSTAWYASSDYPETYFNMTRLDSNRVAGSTPGKVFSVASSRQAYTECVLHSISSNAFVTVGFENMYFNLCGTGTSTAIARPYGRTLPRIEGDDNFIAVTERSRFFIQASGGFLFAKIADSNGTLLYSTSYGYLDCNYASAYDQQVRIYVEGGSVDLSTIVFNSDPSMVPDVFTNPNWKSDYLLAWSFPSATSLSSLVADPPPTLVSSPKFVTPTFSLSLDGEVTGFNPPYVQIGFTISDSTLFDASSYVVQLMPDAFNQTAVDILYENASVQTDVLTGSISSVTFSVDANYNATINLVASDGVEEHTYSLNNLPTTVSYYAYLKTNVRNLGFTNIDLKETPPTIESWVSMIGPLSNWNPRSTSNLVYNGTDELALVATDISTYNSPTMTMRYSHVGVEKLLDAGVTINEDINAAGCRYWFSVFDTVKSSPATNISLNILFPGGTPGGTYVSELIEPIDISWNDALFTLQLSDDGVNPATLYARVVSPRGPWWDFSMTDAFLSGKFRQYVYGSNITGTNLSLTYTNTPSLNPTLRGPRWVVSYEGGSPIGSLDDWTLVGTTSVSHALDAGRGMLETLSRNATPYAAFVLNMPDATPSNSSVTVGLYDDRDNLSTQLYASFHSKDEENYEMSILNTIVLDPAITISQGSVVGMQFDSNSNATFRVRTNGSTVYSNTVSAGFIQPSQIFAVQASGGVELTTISWSDTPLIPVTAPLFRGSGYTDSPPIIDFRWNTGDGTTLERFLNVNPTNVPGTLLRTTGYPVFENPATTSYPYYLAFSMSMVQDSNYARAGITPMSNGPTGFLFDGMTDLGLVWTISKSGSDYEVGLENVADGLRINYVTPLATVSADALFYLELSSRPAPGAGVTVYARVVNPNGSYPLNLSSESIVPTYAPGVIVYPFFQANTSGITFSSISYNNTTVLLGT